MSVASLGGDLVRSATEASADQNMVIRPHGLVLENDGEVAVFIPWRVRGDLAHLLKDYGHAQIQRRGDMTAEEFREEYPLADDAEAEKAKMLETLEISSEEFTEAFRHARSDVRESRNLLKLVRALRRK